MNEPCILPVKPGSLNAKDKAALRKAGVIVVEHESPEEIRFLRPTADIDSSDMLLCAMRALNVKTGVDGSDQREAFAKLVLTALEAKDTTRAG